MGHRRMEKYLSVFFASLFCICLHGCRRTEDAQPADSYLLLEQRTKDQLRRMIGPGEETEWRERYLLPGLKSGLALLDEDNDIDRPILLAAGFLKEQRPVLFLAFLDPKFESQGIFLENSTGYKAQFRVLEWTEEDREWYSTMFRGIFVELTLPDKSANKPAAKSSEDARRIAIPWVATQDEPTVGLLDGRGEEMLPVKAYVDPFFRRPSPETKGAPPD